MILLENGYENIRDLISYSKGGIFSKVLDKSETGNITLFCMGGNTDISEHTSSKNGFIYVVEGEGIFYLEGEEIAMKEGVIIFMKKDAKHSLKAVEDTSFILYLREG